MSVHTMLMTYAEYLVFEEASETKHEYVNGEARPRPGGTPEHARLAAEFSYLLGRWDALDLRGVS